MLAVGETKFFGEPVAAVAAETEDAARAAAAAVRVEYEELPAVLTVAAGPRSCGAARPGSCSSRPRRIARTRTCSRNGGSAGGTWGVEGRLRHRERLHVPDGHALRDRAARLPCGPGRGGRHHLEPIQHPYVLQRVVASALGWPVAKVRIISPDPGGGFGGKGWPKFEPLLAFLALRTGRPVRLVLTLEETFQQVRRASAQDPRRGRGSTSAGRIVFQDIQARLPDWRVRRRRRPRGQQGELRGVRTLSNAERARRRRARCCRTRRRAPRFGGSARRRRHGPSNRSSNDAAAALGIDRLEIRRRNVAKRGEAFIPGDTPADGDWDRATERSRQRNRLDRSACGRARPGHFARPQELFDGVVFVRHRSRCTTTAALRSCRARRTWARARERC